MNLDLEAKYEFENMLDRDGRSRTGLVLFTEGYRAAYESYVGPVPLPCPFCGSGIAPEIKKDAHGHAVLCSGTNGGCGGRGGCSGSSKEAVRKWNARSSA